MLSKVSHDDKLMSYHFKILYCSFHTDKIIADIMYHVSSAHNLHLIPV